MLNVMLDATSGNPTNTYLIPEFLKAADTCAVIDKVCKMVNVPLNKNENITFLRLVTPTEDLTPSVEGVSKSSRSITMEPVTVVIQEFAESFAWSSRQQNMGEVDMFAANKDRLVDLIAVTREKYAWTQFRNCNNVIYNSPALTARNQVNGPITLGRQQIIVRALEANKGSRIKEMSKGSTNYGTYPVEAAFGCLVHSDAKSDIRALPGFKTINEIGGSKADMPYAFGYCEDVLYIVTPEFEPRLAAGAAVGATNMKSVGGVSVDVYPYVYFAKEAFGRVALTGSAGKFGAGGMNFTLLDKADKSDRDNRLRILGSNWHDAPLILNQNWVFAAECGVTANPV